MGRRAQRRKARQELGLLANKRASVVHTTYIMPDNPERNGVGPEKHPRYSKNTSEVKQVITLREAKQESQVPNPKVHKGKVWKTGYRPMATTLALCPTRSSPLSTGRWAVARPLKRSTRSPEHRYPPKIVRRYETYAQACFWRDRLNRLIRRKTNLWYGIVDMELP